MTNQPSGVSGAPRSMIVGGGTRGILGIVACPYAGANAPATVAIASNTAPTSFPIQPLRTAKVFYTAIGRAPCPSGSRTEVENWLMRPCHDRINQFAAFDEVVQDRTYFMQFLAAQPAGHGRRRLTRSCWRSVLHLLDRLIDGTARVKRAICGFDMWHRRIHHRRVNSRCRIILTVVQITANQRGQPAANSAFFLKEGFDRLVLFVFLTLDDAMGRLRRALFPHFLHELRALLAQNSLHAADGVTLAVKQVAYPPQEVDVVRPIVAASSATFHRLNFMEAALPKTQHVLR